MKKLFLLLFSLLISFNSYGEKYTCAYLYKGDALPLSFERQGNYFKKSNTGIDKIIFEDKHAIVLSATYTFNDAPPPKTFTTLLDKEKLTFVFVGLGYKESTIIIEGTCSLTE